MQALQLLAINLTEMCNMVCAHCYLDAKTRAFGSYKCGQNNELKSIEVNQLLSTVASRSNQTMVVLTGGEPLLRKDLETMVQHGAELGLSMVVGTNGSALTEQRVLSLKKAGLMGIGISVDSLQPEKHDKFRGLNGSWSKTMNGIEACRKHQLSFQIHFTITQQNYHEIADVVAFADQVGARVMNFFFLICTGRGKSIKDIEPDTYEDALKEIIQIQALFPNMIIRARCAPHFKRVAHQLEPQSKLNQISGMQGDGCIAGIHYARVSPTGELTACPYIEEAVGNVRQHDFWELWDNASQFQSLRKPQLGGRCGQCEYQLLCGGCRARPMASHGELMDEDQLCNYQPQGDVIIQPVKEQQFKHIKWQADATQRLNNIPGFLRQMIKQRAEAYVADQGKNRVTAEDLHFLAAKRFGIERPAFLTKLNSIKKHKDLDIAVKEIGSDE